MAHKVCPWWLGYFLMNPLRRFGQDPAKILAPFVHEGMTVLEPGPGMGFFTLELARRVGRLGRVVAVDIQQKMLKRLTRRAVKAGLLDRLDVRLASPNSMGLADLASRVDFILAFAVVHESPDAAQFFAQLAAASRPGAGLLMAEPTGHVKPADFQRELEIALAAGFILRDKPVIRRSQTALLEKA